MMDETEPQDNVQEPTASDNTGSEIQYGDELNKAEHGKDTRSRDYVLDLALIILFTIFTVAFIYVPVLNQSILRPVFGFSMALFVPGYALIAALFPKKKEIGGLERIVLSFALSISVVPLIGYGLNFTPWGIRLDPIVISVSVFTVICTILAFWRRYRLDKKERFFVDFSGVLRGLKDEARGEKSTLDKVLNVVLVISVILSVCAIGYMIMTPKQGEQYTEFYILGPNRTASEYPQSFVIGNHKPVIINIANHERRNVTYDLVVALRDNNTTSQLYSEKLTVEDNQTWNKLFNIKPDRLGTIMELQFLLYKDGNMISPYSECRLWINVTNPIEVKTNQIGKSSN